MKGRIINKEHFSYFSTFRAKTKCLRYLKFLAYAKAKKSRKFVPDTLYKTKIEKAVQQNLGKKKNNAHTQKIIFESPVSFNTERAKEKKTIMMTIIISINNYKLSRINISE